MGTRTLLFDAITSLPSNRPRPVRCCNDSVVDCFCSLSSCFILLLSGPKPWECCAPSRVFVRSARGCASERDSTRTTHLAHVTKWLNSSHNASRTSRNPRSRRVRIRLEPPARASRASKLSSSHLPSVVWPPLSPSRSPFPRLIARRRSKRTNARVISSPVRLSASRIGLFNGSIDRAD